jgi:molybdopterin-guanine dinucleotide biosynthesis protein A
MPLLQKSFPEPTGLILAGGRSERMGHDKALLVCDGEPLIARAGRVLASVCSSVLVSVRADQAQAAPYSDCDLVVDAPGVGGPAAGLLAAWRRSPGAVWLVLAVDMPRVDEPLLRLLLDARDPRALATAFEHSDGTLEPLCTVWEPAAHAILRAGAQNSNLSLRRVLESSTVQRIRPPEPERLRSINTPADHAELTC